MNMRKISHWVVVLVVLVIVLQAGMEMYTMQRSNALLGPVTSDMANASNTGNGSSITSVIQIASTTTTVALSDTTVSSTATNEIVISQSVLDQIKQSDPANYDRNIANYKNLLVKRDVHAKFKEELERLVLLNHRISDLLIAYEFLYQAYGNKKDLEAFVLQMEAGKAWEGIFQEYQRSHSDFQPQAFDSNELESLMTTSSMTSDDIMIADRISFVSSKPFKDLIKSKLGNAKSWKETNAELDILNGSAALPRVQISVEQINKYTQTVKLSEQQVAEAFVLAGKVEDKPEIIIEKRQSGLSQEAIMAEYWQQKYNG